MIIFKFGNLNHKVIANFIKFRLPSLKIRYTLCQMVDGVIEPCPQLYFLH